MKNPLLVHWSCALLWIAAVTSGAAASYPFQNPFQPNPAETTFPAPTQSVVPEGLSSAPRTLWQQSSLTGDWNGAREQLLYRGFSITPVYIGEVFGNPTGGAGRGLIYDGVINVALDADLARISGLDGLGVVHGNFLYIHGPSLSGRFVGDLSGTSNIAGYNSPRLQELWYQQSFWRQRITLKLGLIAADTEFFVSDYGALFLNGTFGAFTFVAANLPNAPVYPIAAPGVRLFVKPTSKFYFQAALFSGDPGGQTENKNGLDFRFRDGVSMLFETGFLLNQSPGDRGLEGTYKLGSFVHTGTFNSWDSQRQNELRGAAFQDQGPNYGIYAVADQEIFKSGGRTIGAFLRGGVSPGDVNVVDRYVDGGLNFVGWVPGRINDVLGVGVARSWISSDFGRFQRALGEPGARAETVLEGTYRIVLAPWWTVQPDVQYIFNPGANDNARDAVVLGCRTSIQF